MPQESLPPQVQYWNLKSALLTIALAAILVSLFTAKSASDLVLRSGLALIVGVGISAALAIVSTRTKMVLVRKFCSLVINFFLFVCAIWTMCQLRLFDRLAAPDGGFAPQDDTFPFQFFLGICAAGVAWAIYYLASITEAPELE